MLPINEEVTALYSAARDLQRCLTARQQTATRRRQLANRLRAAIVALLVVDATSDEIGVLEDMGGDLIRAIIKEARSKVAGPSTIH